ncbi:ethanolamine utilization protein EutA [Peptostreptococcaceae bacterium pGA-8]|nr:ethanolamine utilization protein EutA [Peptostreptococcaceae bacterium pGA-8]
MREVINSVGIDIGTSTTQLIFSKLTIENLATSYTVPRISIVNTEVVYRSDIYFTPLTNALTIDSEQVKNIVKGEYAKAKMDPKNLQTGAVIITGETARKENANEVLSALSKMAGEFVVATAGPDLESVLSARGAGTDKMSEEDRNIIANIDIGGGTSNIAIFQKGNLIGTTCLDIGGRLIKVENGKISYVYEKMADLAASIGIPIKVGDVADKGNLKQLATKMAQHLSMALNLTDKDERHQNLYTNDGIPVKSDISINGLTYSGGVADIVYNPSSEDVFRYGDIGPLLGEAINENNDFRKVKRYDAVETIRATVVGAGTHTTEVSGSTIRYEADCLPLKNIPVVKMTEEDEENMEAFSGRLAEKIDIFTNRSRDECVAVAISGNNHTSFDAVQQLAMGIINGLKAYDNPEIPVLVIVESDIGKVLGNALKVLMNQKRKVLCIDNIFVKDGDYVDIGEPVANGRVVPVVTKTLIFNR